MGLRPKDYTGYKMKVAASYSRLTSFERCPKRFHATTVSKSVKEPQNEAASDGLAVHKALELYVSKGEPLPVRLRRHQASIDKFVNAPGERATEFKMAIDQQFQPCGWFDYDVYLRAVADLSIVNGAEGVLVDYKTGKMRDDFDQLEFTTCILFWHYPQLETVMPAYFWLSRSKITTPRDGQNNPKPILRKDIPWLWQKFQTRLDKYQKAHDDMNFPPRTGWQCKGCPVTSCPYFERR